MVFILLQEVKGYLPFIFNVYNLEMKLEMSSNCAFVPRKFYYSRKVLVLNNIIFFLFQWFLRFRNFFEIFISWTASLEKCTYIHKILSSTV